MCSWVSLDRGLSYYQIGLACQMNKQLDQAKESFKAAGTCLEEKISKYTQGWKDRLVNPWFTVNLLIEY